MNAPADEFVGYDVVNVLALPLWRWNNRARYRVLGGWSGDLRTAVYSNGTDHGFASENAEMLLELGPILRRVLEAGVRALDGDADFQAYVVALAIGDHDEIALLERAAAEGVA
jgi:hypothetical protein